jgi:hypothetical protein
VVDEQQIIDTLDEASDYKRGLEKLDDGGREIVERLREWAGEKTKAIGKKRKRVFRFISYR